MTAETSFFPISAVYSIGILNSRRAHDALARYTIKSAALKPVEKRAIIKYTVFGIGIAALDEIKH